MLEVVFFIASRIESFHANSTVLMGAILGTHECNSYCSRVLIDISMDEAGCVKGSPFA